MEYNADISQFQRPLRVAGLNGEPLSRAARTRRGVVRNLVDLLAEVRYPGVIAGSWAHADFHLLTSGESLSDLDLVWPGSSETERRTMIDRISGAGWTGKISIHPTHSFEEVSFNARKIFVIGEHLINVRLHPSPLGHDLSLAKTALLLARQSAEERYASVAARRREVYRDALSVKLGVTESFEDPAALVTAIGEYWVGGRQVAEWFELAGEPNVFDEYKRLLASTADTSSWLYSRMLAKLASVSGNAGNGLHRTGARWRSCLST